MKLKKLTAGKLLAASLLLAGIGVTSCKKEVDTKADSEEPRGIDTSKTLQDYPSEITLDNWEEFVYAPQEVIAHFQGLKASGTRNNSPESNSQEVSTAKLPPGPTGLIQFYSPTAAKKGFVQFPGVTVRYCNYEVISNNLNNPNNYTFLGSCTGNTHICMTVEPIITSNFCDISSPWAGVDAIDIILIWKHILDVQKFTEPAQKIAADTNRDGQITEEDVTLIEQLLLGIDSDWTISENYIFAPVSAYNIFDWLGLDFFAGVQNCQGPTYTDRIGIKTGDVDGSLVNCF